MRLLIVSTRQPRQWEASLPRRVAAEFIGTYMLLLAGTGAVVVSASRGDVISHEGVAASFGLVITVMIYALGHVSGAHFNPAVTLAFAMGRHFDVREVAPYIVAQVAGALVASLTLLALFDDVASLGATIPSVSEPKAFGFEALLTFLLMFVITAVATDSRAVGQAAAIAIGATVGLAALFGGPVTGASMNPARSLAPALVSGNLDSLWLYLVAPPLGAIVAVLAYDFVRGESS